MQMWETLLIARDKGLKILNKELEEFTANDFILANGGRTSEIMITEVAMIEDQHGYSIRKLNNDGSIEDDELYRILNADVIPLQQAE